jgi:hypothetical protein
MLKIEKYQILQMSADVERYRIRRARAVPSWSWAKLLVVGGNVAVLIYACWKIAEKLCSGL